MVMSIHACGAIHHDGNHTALIRLWRQYFGNNKASCLKATQSVPVATQRASPLGCAAADPLFLLSLAPLRLPCKAKNLETQGMKRSSANLPTSIKLGRSVARPSLSLQDLYLQYDWVAGTRRSFRKEAP